MTAYTRKRVAAVAWHTRNLLELSVWIEYCTVSEDNALSFRNDCFKDIYGMARSLEQLDILKLRHTRDFLLRSMSRIQDPVDAQREIAEINDDFDRVASQLDDSEPFLSEDQLLQLASVIGEGPIRDNHLNVGCAARLLGRGDVFTKQNKLLSKFVHPTALLAHFPPVLANEPMDWFLTDAVFLAFQCTLCISAFIVEVFPRSSSPSPQH